MPSEAHTARELDLVALHMTLVKILFLVGRLDALPALVTLIGT